MTPWISHIRMTGFNSTCIPVCLFLNQQQFEHITVNASIKHGRKTA